jgi:quinol monooxygenase YgiN
MYALVATIQIQPEHRDAFIESMLDDARSSVRDEPGCLRFDVLQDESDTNKIYLYEVYRDRAAFEAHTQTPHLIRWRETVKDWFAAPTEVRWASTVFPTDDAWK